MDEKGRRSDRAVETDYSGTVEWAQTAWPRWERECAFCERSRLVLPR
jgi:hypothetical protein